MTSKLIEVRGVTCSYGQHALFHDVSFSVSAGEIYHITGPNGCGKTTLLKCLAGLSSPTLGSIKKQAESQFISCSAWQSDSLTVQQTLNFWSNFYRQDFQPIVQEFELKKIMPMQIGQLSQGQKQRLALARLQIQKNNLWLLDEPTLSLDQRWLDKIQTLMIQHLKSGGAIVLTSHDVLPFKAKEINLGAYTC